MAISGVQNSTTGPSYLVLGDNNYNDTSGGQQRCFNFTEFWKCVSSINPTSLNAMSVQVLHDSISFLGSQVQYKTSLSSSMKSSGYVILEPGKSIPATFTPHQFGTLPSHLYRRWDGSGNLDVHFPYSSADLASFGSSTVSTVISNIDAAVTGPLFSPLGLESTFSGCDCRDTNMDGIVENTLSQYEKHVLFLLVKSYFPGLKSSTGSSGPTTSYVVNPFGISYCAGPTFEAGASRTTAFSTYAGTAFNLDNHIRDTLFSSIPVGASRNAAYSSYIAALVGSSYTSLSQDPRISSSAFPIPIVIPVGYSW